MINALMTIAQGFTCTSSPLTPGFRNEFHAGLQQAFGKYFVLSGEYIWKYTHNAYDFNVLRRHPHYLPIEWHNSKIPGFAIRRQPSEFPRVDGVYRDVPRRRALLPANKSAESRLPSQPAYSASTTTRHFAQTTHRNTSRLNVALGSASTGVTTAAWWRARRLVSETTARSPTTLGGQPAINMVLNDGVTPLTADQEFEAGLTCNGVAATPTKPLPSTCLASQFGSTLL